MVALDGGEADDLVRAKRSSRGVGNGGDCLPGRETESYPWWTDQIESTSIPGAMNAGDPKPPTLHEGETRLGLRTLSPDSSEPSQIVGMRDGGPAYRP